ncbi:MAG TPA: hypothetical protein GX010_01860 [Erysipelotrichaceae bacterium]|nr:hypothetical protein [Erysipelotrichaceae bacterium]
MENNKYVKLHSVLRMVAALIAIIAFISMFLTKQIVHSSFENAFLMWDEAFFGDAAINTKGTVVGFIGYLFILIGGLAGLAFVFIDELIGKDLTKTLSFVAGGLMILGAIMTLLTGVLFRALNDVVNNAYHLAVGPIVFAVLSIIAGLANVASPILEEKGL